MRYRGTEPCLFVGLVVLSVVLILGKALLHVLELHLRLCAS
jgi:hypothetical protein